MIKNDFYLTTLELSDSNSWIMTHNGGAAVVNNEQYNSVIQTLLMYHSDTNKHPSNWH